MLPTQLGGIARWVAGGQTSWLADRLGRAAMKKPTKTARQLLDIKRRSGAISAPVSGTVLDALKIMAQNDIGAVLVMDGDHLVGIFSERDYARKGILEGRAASATPVREVMTSNVIS